MDDKAPEKTVFSRLS